MKIEGKNKTKLFIDFDNTFVDSIQAVLDLYNEDFMYYPGFKKINSYDIETYEFKELKLAKYDRILEYFNQPRFFKILSTMDNALEVLKKLSDKYQIYFISLGTMPNTILKNIYLTKLSNGLGIKITPILLNVKFYNDKSSIDMQGGVFIDDNPKYLESSNASRKICFGDIYSWNENWSGERCYNWYEVLSHLLDSIKL